MLLFPEANLLMFTFIQSLRPESVAFDWVVASFCGEYLAYVFVLAMVVLFWFPIQERRIRRHVLIVAGLAAVMARVVVKPIILLFISEPRPFVYLEFTPLIQTLPFENLQSFPSGHLMFFAAATTVLVLGKTNYAWWFVGATGLMAFGRVYAGVHWPLDVVCGGVLGVVVGIFVYKASYRYSHRLVWLS